MGVVRRLEETPAKEGRHFPEGDDYKSRQFLFTPGWHQP